MPFEIVRNDITRMRVDAIVNSTNPWMIGDGGADYAIHHAAGSGMDEACRALGQLSPGEVKMTGGYGLPCKVVLHTVAPVWQGGTCGEAERLFSCYRKSLEAAKSCHCRSVAFPLISAGINAFPRELAMQIANDAIRGFLQEHDMQVYLVVYDRDSVLIGESMYQEIQSLISDAEVDFPHWLDEHRIFESTMRDILTEAEFPRPDIGSDDGDTFCASHEMMLPCASVGSMMDEEKSKPVRKRKICAAKKPMAPQPKASFLPKLSLEDTLENLDEGFQEMLLRKIDESGMKDSECYKKANIDKRLFSKIRSNKDYSPSKSTVLAFAVALELPLAETEELLAKAGYAFSGSRTFDMIVKFFIERGNYDLFVINEALFTFDQTLLGNCGA